MRALLIVDLQNDFLPGGALAVPEGDRVVPIANRLIDHFELVVATRDWHPPNHCSFAANHAGKKPGDVVEIRGLFQILWPTHCVQDSPGAEFTPEFHVDRVDGIISKGEDPEIDSYSTFFDNGHLKSTGLSNWLRDHDVEDIAICGLTTDYCVLYSVRDARDLGFRVAVFEDACRGVELKKGDIARALDEMRERGAVIARSSDILK